MISKVVIAIGAIGMFSVVAAGGALGLSSFLDAEKRIEGVRRGDVVASEISKLLRNSGSDGLMPVGIQGAEADGYLLPAKLGTPTVSGFNGKFHYCPFGPVSVSAANPSTTSIISANGSSYPVQIVDGKLTAGRPPYARVQQDPNLMGFIIMPIGRILKAASCNEVQWDSISGEFLAPNSTVRAIWRSKTEADKRSFSSGELTFYVSPNGLRSNSGEDADHPTSVERAMSDITVMSPDFANVIFLAGNYTVASNQFYRSGAYASARNGLSRLTLKGLGAVSITSSDLMQVSYPSDMIIQNIAFSSLVRLQMQPGRYVELTNVTMGAADLAGVDAVFRNVALIGSSEIYDNTLAVIGGKLRASDGLLVRAPAGKNSIGIYRAADVLIEGQVNLSAVTGALQFGVYISPGSDLVLKNAQLTLDSPATNYIAVPENVPALPIFVHGGNMVMSNSTIGSTALQNGMVRVDGGGLFSMDSGSIISGVNVLVTEPIFREYGASSISGTGQIQTFLAISRCWDGFSLNQNAMPGVSSSPRTSSPVDTPAPSLDATSTIEQRRAAALVVADNMSNLVRRAINRSNWSCIHL